MDDTHPQASLYRDPFDAEFVALLLASPLHTDRPPFDMGDPALTYNKKHWTIEHRKICCELKKISFDTTLLTTFLATVPFPFMSDPSGGTLLTAAAYYGHVAAVKILIKHGHPVHVTERFGCTPLHAAAQIGHAELMSLLIEHGHPVVVKTRSGETALHDATIEGHRAAMAVLIQHNHPLFDLDLQEYPLLRAVMEEHRRDHCHHHE